MMSAMETTSRSRALGDEAGNVRDSLANFAKSIASALSEAAKDVSSLEVKTFTSGAEDLGKLTYTPTTNQLEGSTTLRLRALTHISFDGDVAICLPEKDGQLDKEVWEIHSSMVAQAHTNRAEFFKAVSELAMRLTQL
jgi:hypothetical protein